MDNPAQRLIGLFRSKAGVAAHFNISKEAVRLWLKHGIPTERALIVEEQTAGTQFAISAMEILRYARWRDQGAASTAPAAPAASAA